MFELPEFVTLSRQMNETLRGKRIAQGCLGNTPHRFVWYNRKPDEFTRLTQGKTVGKATSRGKWLFVPLDPGYVLVFGECGGKLLFHPVGTPPPKSYHLLVNFTDGSALSETTQMWGAMELYEKGKELQRVYIRDMRTTPIDPEFTYAYFSKLIDSAAKVKKTTAKGLLTADQLIPGIGNSIAQDILFNARLDPRHAVDTLTAAEKRTFHKVIVKTVNQAIDKGGRYDEVDLYGKPGGYVRLMDKNALSRPCPGCGGPVSKITYLGGACYFCAKCQH